MLGVNKTGHSQDRMNTALEFPEDPPAPADVPLREGQRRSIVPSASELH